jgi:GTP cyclohydrolase I
MAESSASAPVYPLLKRDDEALCDHAGVRQPRLRRRHGPQRGCSPEGGHESVQWFSVEAINHESIHNHGAFAKIEWSRKNGDAAR